MKEIQKLMSSIGKKRTILLVVVIVINVVMLGVWQKLLIPQQEQLTTEAASVQATRSKLQTDIRELPAKHAALEASETRYDDLEAHGLFTPQDRIEARGHMGILRQETGLSAVNYSIEPQKTIDTPALAPTEKDLVMSEIKLKMDSLTDHEILKFLDKMQTSFSGLVVLKDFKMTREKELTNENLMSLKNGETTNFVSSEASFEWYSITPKASTTSSPMAQAFQGATP